MNVEILDDSLDITNGVLYKDDSLLHVGGGEYKEARLKDEYITRTGDLLYEEMKDNKQETLIDRSVISTDYESDNTSLNVEGKRDILLEMKGEALFGRDVKVAKPICIGNVYAFWYIKNQPMIVIGPHCI
jgi:hypothetical protein